MITRAATVQNAWGIHCRPSSLIAQEARLYEGTITVHRGTCHANARSVLELVGLALGPGHGISITVEGPDEVAMAERFVALFEKHFDFSH